MIDMLEWFEWRVVLVWIPCWEVIWVLCLSADVFFDGRGRKGTLAAGYLSFPFNSSSLLNDFGPGIGRAWAMDGLVESADAVVTAGAISPP